MDIDVKTSILEQRFEIHSTEKKIHGKIYQQKVVLEDKLYPNTYHRHQPRSVVVDEIPSKIKTQ